jgi:filamentous hemagglutinin family protein
MTAEKFSLKPAIICPLTQKRQTMTHPPQFPLFFPFRPSPFALRPSYLFLLFSLFSIPHSLLPTPVFAQVTPDGTVGTIVTGGPAFTIDGGTRPSNGPNLFHSFSQFSVPTGGSAIFNNAPDVTNIISRVTGGRVSSIDGLIQANGTANLFLINPAGIIFGPNASLNIGGSFIGSTAQSLKFSDGTEFSATNPSASPLLTINVPIGLQFGSNPGSITHQAVAGFQVATGKTLALIGGPLTIPGGTLMAPAGDIELGSVAGNSQVGMNPTTFVMDYAGVQGFQDIQLSQGAQVDVSGAGGGSIQVQARQLSLKQGAQIRSNTLGSEPGNSITIRASERVDIVGAEDLSPYNVWNGEEDFDTDGLSGIYTAPQVGSSGNGTNIRVESPILSMSRAGAIAVKTYGSGNTGNLTIQSHTIDILGNPDGNGYPTTVTSDSLSAGQGGNVTINADRLVADGSLLVNSVSHETGNSGNLSINVRQFQVLNGAQFSTSTWAAGNGGTLTINATESVELNGFGIWELGRFSSGVFSSSGSQTTGKGGSVTITTGQLKVLQGGEILTSANGKGSAGNVVIRANEIEVSNPIVDFVGAVSGIVTSVGRRGRGEGGTLDIVTDRLQVLRGGQIYASNTGQGKAGSINIQAQDIDIKGISEDGEWRSGIFATSINNFPAGSINLTGDRLNVQDGARIAVSNIGSGDAGSLNVNARRLFLDNGASLQAEVNGGNQGNITLQVQDLLLLRHGSQIVTSAKGASTGGNITINAGVIAGFENSDIIANAVEGRGGNIQITTKGIFGLKYRLQLTPENDITASSQFGLNGTVAINNVTVDPAAGLVQLPVVLADASRKMGSVCDSTQGSSFIYTGRGGIPYNPLGHLESPMIWEDLRDLSEFQNAPPVQPPSRQNVTPTVIVEANAIHRNPDGTVELVAAGAMPTLAIGYPVNCVKAMKFLEPSLSQP